jgi:acetate kinase
MDGKKISHTEPMQAKDYTEAAASIFSWLKTKETHRTKRHSTHRDKGRPRRQKLFRSHKITPEVVREIHNFERLAPLHNKSSLELFEPIRRTMVKLPFTPSSDTASTAPLRMSLPSMPFQPAWRKNTTSAACLKNCLMRCWTRFWGVDELLQVVGRLVKQSALSK